MVVAPESAHSTALPLCVDLDGTLVKTDLLIESLLLLFREQPLALLLVPLWLLKGKAHLKQEVTARVHLDVTTLPYREELLEFLAQERRAGRKLILATAADRRVATQVAEHVGLFDEVVASDGSFNCSGEGKLRALQAACQVGFIYAGDAQVDLKVWRGAAGAVVVGDRLVPKVEGVTRLERTFASRLRRRDLFGAMRLHQWVKNVLVFVPLFLSHQLTAASVLGAALAFLAFGLCASAVYLINDMLDLEADRLHARKRLRPFAAGSLPLKVGFALVPLLLLAAVLATLPLSPLFLGVLGFYFALTLSYSLYLKRVPMLDVILLALLYTVRIVAGAVAVGVLVSPWLLAFSTFFFLNLAFVKRFSELCAVHKGGAEASKARGYEVDDLEGLANLGASSGYVSVLVVALYINSEAVVALYRSPLLLWLLCPLLLYWVSRVWLLARRGEMHDDPVVFALRDRVSYIVGALSLLVGAAAAWGWA